MEAPLSLPWGAMTRSFFRKNIDAMGPYVPGEQPPAGARVIKLNTNENPYPPSPRVMQAVAAVTPDQLRRYPHPLGRAFREAAADVFAL